MSFMTFRGDKKTTPPAQRTPPPAGWFIDPANSTQVRWWDGLGWTEHCAPATGLPAVREPARVVVSPVVATPPAMTAQPAVERVDDDPSDVLRRVLREVELADLDRWPLGEQVEVAGEQYYAKEIRKLFIDCGMPITAAGVTVENEPCLMVPEPWNPHDPNAVAVMVRKYQVGHLPADLAKRYHPVLIQHAQQRLLVTGIARVWSKLESGALVRARATIAVPEIAVLVESLLLQSSGHRPVTLPAARTAIQGSTTGQAPARAATGRHRPATRR